MTRCLPRLLAVAALALSAAVFPPASTSLAARQSLDRVFPVRGQVSYGPDHHDYPATDIFAGCGRRVVSPVRGTVLEVSRRDRWDPDTDRPKHRGGKFVSIRGADGVRYYGSHLRSLAKAAHGGGHVRAGQLLGRVGRSGNARYTPCHLHFGLSPLCRRTGDWWIRRGVVSPYRFLRSWEQGSDLSPRHRVKEWRRHNGCSRAAVFG